MATRISVGPTRYSDPRELPTPFDAMRIAHEAGLSLSAYYEQIQPTPDGSRLDAYERQLQRFNIRTQDDLVRGVIASTVEEFWTPTRFDGSKLTTADWAAEGTRFESNEPQSWALFPEFINRILRVQPLAEDVLSSLVAVTTPINSASYQAIYLQDTLAERQLSRTAEGAELARMFVKLAFQAKGLVKYGIALEMTYEILRRLRLPIFTVIVERVRSQIRLDQAAEAVDVLVNGDGNNNSANNFNVSTLDPTAPAGPGTVTDPYLSQIGDPTANSTIAKRLTYSAFLTWRASLYPLGMTTIVGRMNELLQVLTLQMPNIDPTMLLALLEGGADAQMGRVKLPNNNLWRDVDMIYLPSAPGGMLIGLNHEQALEMLMEEGSDIAENDRDILRQRQFMTISQDTAFDKIISSASTTLSFQ